jgi:hypothetical protein
MMMDRCLHCGKPHMHAPDGQRDLRLYTPTLEGFERFMRQTVGLDTDTPDRARKVATKSFEGRNKQ